MGKRRTEEKKSTKVKKASKEEEKIVSKKEVRVKDIITVKRKEGVLYASVHYTEKGSKGIKKGLIPTIEFTDSQPELLLKFYEKNIEFTKEEDEE